MEAEQSRLTEMICDLALEIIYLLTGEKHAAVKMASIEGLLRGVYPPMSVGGDPSQTSIMKPPSQSRITESNNQEVLEVTSKIIELLAGGVSEDRNSSPVCSFMEERGNVEKDDLVVSIMEDHPPLTLQDGSRRSNPPERCLRPLYFQDSTLENQEILLYDQVNDKMKVKEELEELYVRGNEECLDEEISQELLTGSTQEGYNTPHHYQEENMIDIKQEEEEHVRGGELYKEEEIAPQINADWWHTQDFQEQPPGIVSNRGIQSDDNITSDYSDVITRHLHTVHTPKKTFCCPECGKCFSEKASLIKHEHVHMREKSYSCSDCGMCFSQKVHFIAHKGVHTGKKPYSCSECGRCFSQKASVIKHKRIHTKEKPYTCSECGRCFSDRSNFIRHKDVHTGKNPYSCSKCGKCFPEKSALLRHKRVHTKENAFSCSECGKCFSRKFNFIIHKRVHTGEKPYPCTDCGRCFSRKANLIRHKQQVHLGKGF